MDYWIVSYYQQDVSPQKYRVSLFIQVFYIFTNGNSKVYQPHHIKTSIKSFRCTEVFFLLQGVKEFNLHYVYCLNQPLWKIHGTLHKLISIALQLTNQTNQKLPVKSCDAWATFSKLLWGQGWKNFMFCTLLFTRILGNVRPI